MIKSVRNRSPFTLPSGEDPNSTRALDSSCSIGPMHAESLRAQLSFTDRTASNAVFPEHVTHLHVDPPAGLYSQPTQPTQEQTQQTGRQPLDLRKTAAITVAIANVQLRDDDMNVSQEAGPSSSRPPLHHVNSSTSRPLTIEVASRMPSQDMW